MQDILLFLQNHWMLGTALVIVFILLILVEYVRLQRGAKRISTAQAIQLINYKDAVIVDIRSGDAYAAGHIVDSISIPMTELETKQKKLDKYKLQPIILVCAAGLESPRAANSLMKHGMNALVLAGGIRGWRDAELPLVKD